MAHHGSVAELDDDAWMRRREQAHRGQAVAVSEPTERTAAG